MRQRDRHGCESMWRRASSPSCWWNATGSEAPARSAGLAAVTGDESMPTLGRIDFDMLKHATGARIVELAAEEEFRSRFPDCEVGAMPPFGNLYGMRTFVAAELADDDVIAFNAGSHTELMQLTYSDFEAAVRPETLAFSAPQTV